MLFSSGFDSKSRVSTIRNVVWAVSNLCRGKPAPNFDSVRPALPVLSKLLRSSDTDTVTDVCWALSYLSDGKSEHISAVMQADVVPLMLELLGRQVEKVQTPALRCLGN